MSRTTISALRALLVFLPLGSPIACRAQVNLKNQVQGVLPPANGGCGTTAGCLPTTGGTITGNLHVPYPGNDPANAVPLDYVNKFFMSLQGGTLLGPLILQADPTAALGAVTKQYVDNNYLPILGGAIVGGLTIGATGDQGPQGVLTESFGDGRYLQRSGGTVTGLNLNLPAPLTNPQAAVNLQYTDGHYLQLTGGVVNGGLKVENPANTSDSVLTQGVGDFRYLSSSGGTMTGFLTMTPAAQLASSGPNGVLTQAAGDGRYFNPTNQLASLNLKYDLFATNIHQTGPHADVSAPQFGGVNGSGSVSGATLNQTSFQNTITFATQSNGANIAVYVPPGIYYIAGTLELPNNVLLYSDSSVGATLIETLPKTPLMRVKATAPCQEYSCYGGIQHIALAGQGAATQGALLEMDAGYMVLDDIHFFNTGGRGLQMNGASERVMAYNLTFYQVRWPLILSGDSNENYFFGTHVIEAGEVAGSGTFGRYCYSVNCVNGNYPAASTTSTPTTLYSDPHASVFIDKAVNVAFIGGSFKSTPMLAGAKVWNGGNIRFENIYNENPGVFGNPANNKAYIIGGKAEQTYTTSALSGTGLSVAVNDASWMPQFYGSPADAAGAGVNDWYPYVILPQDYVPGSNSPSAYVSGLKQGQYEVVNAAAFSSDGNFYIQQNGRNNNLSTAPAGTAWPAGSIVQEWPQSTQGDVMLSQVHLNVAQGVSQNGWAYDCEQTNYRNCAEIEVGLSPDIQNLTANPATNLTGIAAPLGTQPQAGGPTVPVGNLNYGVTLDDPQMFTGALGTGLVLAEGNAGVVVRGGTGNPQLEASAAATQVMNGGVSYPLDSTGGNSVFAPLYANGTLSNVTVRDVTTGGTWQSNGWYQKLTQVYKPYQQYGQFMNGTQFQNGNCLFDLNANGSNQSTSRFCVGGGPSNTSPYKNAGAGYGFGAEYDFWNGSSWLQMMRAWSGGLFTQGTFTAAQINGEITVDGMTYPTVNAAWTAAAAAANATGNPQTIKLGPGTFPVTDHMIEPTNGACISVIGSSGMTTGADIANVGTTLSLANGIAGAVFQLGNATLTEGCTFRDLHLLLNHNANQAFVFQWYRGLLIENVAVNDPIGNAIILGENASSNHQSIGAFRNISVSWNASQYRPGNRGAYGMWAYPTAIDSSIDLLTVRNAQIAAFENQGGGWTTHNIHGFGYPYTCASAPCSNTTNTANDPTASFATNYLVEDQGTGGNVYVDSYIDSPAIAGFHLMTNGVQINGGHIQWPDTTSFPAANIANVDATVTSNIIITNIDCLNMSPTAGTGLQAGAGVQISYQSTGSVPPSFSTVDNLAGCGDFYQTKQSSSQTAFERGNANYYNTNPGLSNGLNPKVWASPLASGGNYTAFAAQLYSGYLGDEYAGGVSGQPSNFNVLNDGSVRSSGGMFANAQIVTAAQQLTTANHTVLASTANGAYTLTLPSCYTKLNDGMPPTGLDMVVAKTDSSTNALTLATLSNQSINLISGGTTTSGSTLSSTTPTSWSLTCGPDNNWYARGSAAGGGSGTQGPPGQAATIAVGTVSALAAGATPTVTNSGSSSAATFNFGIPAGATGPQGPAGTPATFPQSTAANQALVATSSGSTTYTPTTLATSATTDTTNAANITTGKLPAAQLPSNVVTSSNNISGLYTVTISNNVMTFTQVATPTLPLLQLNGTIITNVPRMTWTGNFSSTTATGNSNASVWQPSSAIKITRLDVHYSTASAGCTTYPVIGIYDSTAGSWVATQTNTSGSYSVFTAITPAVIAAGHTLNMGVQTAAAGCTTNPAGLQLTMEYIMQ